METVGTLELKLARLQKKLNILAVQEEMSSPYPENRDKVQREFGRVRGQIRQLTHLLMILFDIDSTILDMRHMVRSLLQAYDRHAETHYFDHLTIGQISVNENDISPLLADLELPEQAQQDITIWYE